MHVTTQELQALRDEYTIPEAMIYDETTSTNDHALTLASALPPQVTSPSGILALIVARKQTAGRGRRHSQWWSASGALMFSMVIDMEQRQLPRSAWPQASLTTGLAVTRSLRNINATVDFQLKWPNDVYLSGKKVCGILIEAPPTSSPRLVIGIGINIANSFRDAPEELTRIATSLVDATGDSTPLGTVLAQVLSELDQHLALLSSAHTDRAAATLLWERWREVCLLENRTITITHEGREIHGRCLGIDRDGALQLDTPTGVARFFAGSITHFSDYGE